jgi:valyl-tRNA synthetase
MPQDPQHDLPKAYDPAAIEEKWAEYWVSENLFAQPSPTETGGTNAEGQRLDGQSFTILLPPPNVTGRLHMGHMLNQTEMDILTRWHRMRGDKTLWLPGTDHAGIATQMMVEKQVTAEGSSRAALGREAFLARVWQWKQLYGGAILDQMKRLGASVDWQREYFTMDANLSVAVREAFTRLYAQGLIYRGAYIVNWCPGCQTAISDLEVVHEETNGKLWEIRYPVAGEPDQFLTIATTRPETMLGDTAVAIHPDDERYTHLHGKSLILPLGPGMPGREIPIVLDSWVSPDFGTGAVKVTPAHDPNDFALGQRHHLPSINVMDDKANISIEGPYFGLNRYVARKRILEDLEAQGLLGQVREHKLSVGHCDRSKDVVEPRLSTQWFIKIEPLAKRAIEVVEQGHIRFTPDQYKKTYLNWMSNIHDWCISRQLWWGHRIPAWHCAACHQIVVPAPGQSADPTACTRCGSTQLTQETDVLDTWFSSGLLPISVFGWPFQNKGEAGAPSFPGFAKGGIEGTEPGAPGLGSPRTGRRPWGGDMDSQTGVPTLDFETFYPTSLLVTGFDILFFWVARMIMLGCWFAADVPMPDGSFRSLADSVPFREVYIHALVRDANREKMSKTKGNVIDPIEIVKKYGTDAVRFTLASMASPGTDIAFNEARTEGYRAFANKIWNAARFIFMNVDKAAEAGIVIDRSKPGGMPSLSSSVVVPNQPSETASAASGLVSGHDFSRADNTPENAGALAPAEAPLEARWIVAELHKTADKVNQALDEYRFDEAANFIYQFFWGSFCDWYLEIVKLRLNFSEAPEQAGTRAALNTLLQVFEASLRLLSPFMPFIAEEIWTALHDGNPPLKSIALTHYPQSMQSNPSNQWPAALVEMEDIQKVITSLRALRKDAGVPEKELVPARIQAGRPGNVEGIRINSAVRFNQDIIKSLARISDLQVGGPLTQRHIRSESNFDVSLDFDAPIDIPAERDRLTKEIAKLEKALTAAERQLSNEPFLAKAPAHIVEGLKKQQAQNTSLLAKTKAALEALPAA